MTFDRREFLIASSTAIAVSSCTTIGAPSEPTSVDVWDDRLLDLVDPESPIVALASGFAWSEGPVWDRSRDCLYFNDVPGNITWRWSETYGKSEFLNPSGMPASETAGFREAGANGLWFTKDGYLLICNHGKRAIENMDLEAGSRTTLVASFEGKRFNSPNDIVQAPDGTLYFTDPPYGLEGMNDSPLKELDVNGVYRLSPDGQLSRILADMTFPNGVSASPDGSLIYISQSDPDAPVLRVCNTDGSNVRTLVDFTPYMKPDAPGLPDGMAVSEEGMIFQTGPGGVFVVAPNGDLLGRIRTGKATANCCFGDADGKTLYMTAHDTLMRLQLRVRGVSWSS